MNAIPKLYRCAELMAQHADPSVDLADATLVTAAESSGGFKLRTFDPHYRVYALKGNHPPDSVPYP